MQGLEQLSRKNNIHLAQTKEYPYSPRLLKQEISWPITGRSVLLFKAGR